ncbi:Uncharacterised protein [Acinetobacter baumannii]|nr:Uncharacterised protein [Acinetobacter baumannii]
MPQASANASWPRYLAFNCLTKARFAGLSMDSVKAPKARP